jgi:hypothetical protein
MTKAQADSPAGQEFIQMALDLAGDGELTPKELLRLRDWLKTRPEPIPAFHHIRVLLDDAWEDGVITDAERSLLHRQIERVTPRDVREKLIAAREEAERERMQALYEQSLREEEEREIKKRLEYPASDAQLHYLAALGVEVPDDISKDEASTLIDDALSSNKSITPRQWMVLRFWNRIPPPAHWGRRAVSEWMDEWYAENPDRLAAWELFKEETGDFGNARDPERVPIGIGEQYLNRVKGRQAKPGSRVHEHTVNQKELPWLAGLIFIFAGFILSVIIISCSY